MGEQGSGEKHGEQLEAGEPREEMGESGQVWSEAAQLVERAAELVKERSGWTRRALARDRHSRPVSPSSGRAVRFCASGALMRAYSEQSGIEIRLVGEAAEETFRPSRALDLAFTMAAYHVAFFLPLRSQIILGVRKTDAKEVLLDLIIPTSASKSGKARTLTLSARKLLEELNDFRALKHEDVLFGLMLSRIALELPERDEGAEGDEA